MLTINEIRESLVEQVNSKNIKETGYNCLNGNRYVELRHVTFQCNETCIFQNIPKLPYIDDSWYEENYTPILYKDNQLENCINKLIENKHSRQAVIIMSSTDNLQCTMYMTVSIVKQYDTDVLEYVVHMRSNDAVEFRTDYRWHLKLYRYLYERLLAHYDNLMRKHIIWYADSLQLYEQYFEAAVKSI